MNIQIFGSKKSNDSKKAERFFKERGIKYQFIDMKEKGMSRGEFDNVCRALGGFSAHIDPNAKDRQTLTLMKYLSESDAEEKLFENQHLIALPVVRSGRQATLGYQPEVWKGWE